MKLYPHQAQALEKTKSFNHVAYYLDMGLGKTFIGSEKLKELNTNHNLIVCQKSKLNDWYEHMKTFYPDYNTIIYNKPHTIPDHSIVIINYDLVWRRKELLTTLRDFTLLLDESSMIKNEKSNRSKFILKMKPTNVILLSGTPTGGKYEQLWSQLKLLGWNISKQLYWNEFIKFVKIDVGGFPIQKVTGYKNVDRLKDKLKQYGAIFMKSDEVFQLPEQIEQIIKVDNTKEYKKFKKDRFISMNAVNLCEFEDDSDFYGKDTTSHVELVGDTSLNKMLYLRQLASQFNKNKTAALKDLLESTNDRIVIFYNFNMELKIIQDMCNKFERPISVINGHEKNLKNFNECNDCVLLGQYQAAAMGLNLQLSNKIIYFSLPLQSELFEQSKKRIHRIGQDKTCFYYYLITKNSIDEQIYETLKERGDYTNKLFEESDL